MIFYMNESFVKFILPYVHLLSEKISFIFVHIYVRLKHKTAWNYWWKLWLYISVTDVWLSLLVILVFEHVVQKNHFIIFLYKGDAGYKSCAAINGECSTRDIRSVPKGTIVELWHSDCFLPRKCFVDCKCYRRKLLFK